MPEMLILKTDLGFRFLNSCMVLDRCIRIIGAKKTKAWPWSGSITTLKNNSQELFVRHLPSWSFWTPVLHYKSLRIDFLRFCKGTRAFFTGEIGRKVQMLLFFVAIQTPFSEIFGLISPNSLPISSLRLVKHFLKIFFRIFNQSFLHLLRANNAVQELLLLDIPQILMFHRIFHAPCEIFPAPLQIKSAIKIL